MIVLYVIGFAVLGIGLALASHQYNMLKSRTITVGRVTELPASRGSKGGTVYRIVAEFKDMAGQPRTYRSTFSSSSPGYRVGDAIRIFYDRASPDRCGIASFGYRFGISAILVVIGLALLAVGYAFQHGNEWVERQFPASRI